MISMEITRVMITSTVQSKAMGANKWIERGQQQQIGARMEITTVIEMMEVIKITIPTI